MSEKISDKNALTSISLKNLVQAITIPALLGAVWLISTLLIAVGLRKTSSQPVSVFFLSLFGIYLQAALVGILTPILLKTEGRKIFTLFLSSLISETLALAGFYAFLRLYYGSWFLPVIILSEPLNDSFFLVGITIVISLFYYWLFIYPLSSASIVSEEAVAEKKEDNS